MASKLRGVANLTMLGPNDPEGRTAVVSVTIEGYVPEQLAMVLDQVFDVATALDCIARRRRTARLERWRAARCASVPATSTRRMKSTKPPRRC